MSPASSSDAVAIGRANVWTGAYTDVVVNNALTIEINRVPGKSITVANVRQGKINGTGPPALKVFCETIEGGPFVEVYSTDEDQGPPPMMGKSSSIESGEIATSIGMGIKIEFSANSLIAGYLYLTFRIA